MGTPVGTTTQCGTKRYCSAIILTTTPPTSSAGPRLLSTNSPRRCRVCGLTWLGPFRRCSRPDSASYGNRTVSHTQINATLINKTRIRFLALDPDSAGICSWSGGVFFEFELDTLSLDSSLTESYRHILSQRNVAGAAGTICHHERSEDLGLSCSQREPRF